MLVVLSDVHPFASVAPDSVAVDIVTPDQVKEQLPEPPPKPEGQDLFDLSSKAAAPASAPPAAASTPAVPQSVAKSSPATPQQQQQAAVPQTNAAPGSISSPLPASNRRQPAAQSAPQAQPAVPTPAFTPAQPDLSVQYHVLLGLPQARPGDGFDAAATEKADVGSSPIAEFRRHLRTCSTLPKEIAPSDRVAVKLRVLMSPDGRLAAEPALIEASASMKGPLLMQSAISALQSCQPYTMLPPDKYREWKSLDLSFTPQDFGGAS